MRRCIRLASALLLICNAIQAEDTACSSADCDLFPTVACDELGCCEFGNLCGSWMDGIFGDCGLIKKSDHDFDNFISPMTNPVFFEDPRTLTEARFIFINQSVPGELFGNGAQLYALQMRAALTENLSLIATKDGFIVSDNVLIDDGWADVSAGLKYNVYKDVASQSLVSVGTTFEMPVGSTRTLQGNGDGEFHLFASAATQLFENWHYVTGSGFRLPVDSSQESQVWSGTGQTIWITNLPRRGFTCWVK